MKKQYIFAAIAIFCWSTVATASKLLLGSMSSFQVLCVSALFAAVCLLIFNVVTKRIRVLRRYRPADYLKAVLICLPGTLLYYLFYYAGTSRMLASQAFIVNYLWPIMSVLFACILLKEKMTGVKLAAIFLSFAGVALVIGEGIFAFNPDTLLGALFCVLGAVSYGAFTALNQKFGYDACISTMLAYFATALITGIFLLVQGTLPQLGLPQVLGLIWNGAATMGVANAAWILALGGKETAKISNIAYLTPFLSLIWTALILKERITVFSVVGLVVIVLGILIQLLHKEKPREGCVQSDKERH